jgi:5-enolpyruvylshikimate-3-phosphate synthase
MAMAFAIAALGAVRPSRVEGADVVAVSYPGFFDALSSLVARADEESAS